jgi:L-lactate dehydrogenase complex protein LldE
MIADIFIPCFIDQLYPETAVNMVSVLNKLGVKTRYNKKQTCCGQPAFNSGFHKEAKAVADKFIEDFADSQYIVIPSGSCAGFVRNYYNKLCDGKTNDLPGNRLFEFSEFLVDVVGVEDTQSTLNAVATYHDACGALRECGIRDSPRKLLANVKGLELREMNDREVCCGFGGTFTVKFESISMAMCEQKVEQALLTGASCIISTDLSCLMHLDGYIRNKKYPLKVMHIADVLASSV